MAEGERIRSIEKAGEVLDMFTRAQPVHTLAELSRALGWNRSSALRIVSTLTDMGFLERTGAGQSVSYRLGVRILQLAAVASNSIDVRRAALPHMHELAEETGDSAYLVLSRDFRAFVIERVTGSYIVRSEAVRVGDFLPLNRGAAATAMLAYLSPAEQARALEVAGATPEEHAEWELRSSAIRQAGYSVSRGEVFAETAGVGVPIFGADGSVVAALSLGGVMDRFQPERVALLAQPLIHAGAAISERMGYGGADVEQHPEFGTASGTPATSPHGGLDRTEHR